MAVAGKAVGGGDAAGGADRGGGVAGDKGVVDAFVGLGETGKAPRLAEGVEAVLPAGEDLVGVALVADVPDDAVLRRVEHPVEGDRQLHRPQVGGEVAAGAGDVVD